MPRQITNEAVSALLANMNFRKSNTEVRPDEQNRQTMYLHGNAIARFGHNGNLEIRDGGWQSNTTKERLNGIPNVSICQRNYQWFLNGKPWDGEWTVVS